MQRWEYEIVSFPIKEVYDSAVKEADVISCDPGGICLHRDMPTVAREILVKKLNEQGNAGWELVESHFHSVKNELTCIFKRLLEFKQLQH